MWMNRSFRGESEKYLTIYTQNVFFFRPYFEIWTQTEQTEWDEQFVFSELEKRLTAMVTVGIFAYSILPMEIFL